MEGGDISSRLKLSRRQALIQKMANVAINCTKVILHSIDGPVSLACPLFYDDCSPFNLADKLIATLCGPT